MFAISCQYQLLVKESGMTEFISKFHVKPEYIQARLAVSKTVKHGCLPLSVHVR